jgi:hypothetical protein
VADLASHAFDIAPAEGASLYGAKLPAVVACAGGREWLEAAVLAGHLPHIEGIALALRGVHLWTLEQVAECEAGDFSGDSVDWLEGAIVSYRDLIEMLEHAIEDCERRRERMSD